MAVRVAADVCGYKEMLAAAISSHFHLLRMVCGNRILTAPHISWQHRRAVTSDAGLSMMFLVTLRNIALVPRSI